MLWYYTRHIRDDLPFLAYLQKTVDLIHDVIPHDAIILGLPFPVLSRVITLTDVCRPHGQGQLHPSGHLQQHPAWGAAPARINLVRPAVSPASWARLTWPSAHTINQPEGTLFMVPDMTADRRFASSPLVTQDGLRSYVGVPLRLPLPGDRGSVALGTLCATSWSVTGPLSAAHQRALLRFADMIVHDIVEHARHLGRGGRAERG
jgi:GAF domain-containing protein